LLLFCSARQVLGGVYSGGEGNCVNCVLRLIISLFVIAMIPASVFPVWLVMCLRQVVIVRV